MKKKLFPFFIICCLVLLSCTEEIQPKKYTYSQLLTGKNNKSWRIHRIILREEGEDDVILDRNDCESDDRYIFYANSEKLFEVTNGREKCQNPEEPEEDLLLSYTWSLNNANATINMVMPHLFGYYLIPFIVKEMDENDMDLELFINEEATVSYVFQFRKTDEE